MKKLLALVLALVMVMALAVSAFAAVVIIDKDEDEDDDELIELNIGLFDPEDSINYATYAFEDEDFAFIVNMANAEVEFEKIEATGTGIVKNVTVSDVDPDKYDLEGTELENAWKVYDKANKVDVQTGLTYDAAVDAAEELNKNNKTTKYVVKCMVDVKIVEFTLEGNTGVAYTEGKLTIKATDEDGDTYSAKYDFINDVAIFYYENVKSAAENDFELLVGDEGYSDYFTAENGYVTPAQDVYATAGATVVPTTSFRAIAGKEIVVDCNAFATVTISEVAANQKGVNFANDVEVNYVDEDDPDEVESYELKFYGNQVIASDYTIDIETGINYFDLREAFGKKLEEEDIITYYITKDGKAFDSFTVDYMTVDYNDEVEITINGKAGTTLGDYCLTITAPAAETEENPNTGAESLVAVVAAVAVVSAAAAVSLKK